ncbi:MORN repeat-containing protein 4 isoform X4 [Acanthopagrus latus]|uniref:MORN repeat-containing protein 4 isoform X4 n=1 Tax=Acanthopagrus latus TaxID=8177 RepID=UPI00187CA405|nr:MORN repeat-containing protein 4 isoform X4 [Acanthopagrus latus]
MATQRRNSTCKITELWRLNTDSRILINFCRCTMESILTGCIKPGVAVAPPSTTRTAQHLNSSKLPPLEELYSKQCWKKAKRIIKHPKHKLFCLLPTGRRCSTQGQSEKVFNGSQPQRCNETARRSGCNDAGVMLPSCAVGISAILR